MQNSFLNSLYATQTRQPFIEYWVTWDTRQQKWQYYWHLKAGNGHLVATGGEGFDSFSSMKQSVANAAQLMATAITLPFQEKK